MNGLTRRQLIGKVIPGCAACAAVAGVGAATGAAEAPHGRRPPLGRADFPITSNARDAEAMFREWFICSPRKKIQKEKKLDTIPNRPSASDHRLLDILEKGSTGTGLSKEECKYLLGFPEHSREAALTRMTADQFTRQRLNNAGVIIGQIGVEISPCPGGCNFCAFAKDHTQFQDFRITDGELVEKIGEFTGGGDLYGLFLMTMHIFDKDRLLHSLEIARRNIQGTTQLWINIGDVDYGTCVELKQAGVRGAYHVCRLREGLETDLKPQDRIRTMENLLSAGLELYSCCEPIGPEHTIDEIVDNFFIGIDLGCIQHACMRRVPVKGNPFEDKGMISELRMAQCCAVLALTAPQVEGFKFMSIHEPNQAGLLSGANLITAESGGNPRDLSQDTKENRGWTLAKCRKLLWESGFTNLRLGDESLIPLTSEYVENHGSGMS